MGAKIFWFCVFAAICVFLYFGYDHYRQQKQMDSGEVSCQGCMTPDQKAAFDKENSGETADGQSEHKIRTARQEDAAGNPLGAAAAGQTVPATAPAATPAPTSATATPTPAAAPTTQAATTPGSYALGTGAQPVNSPASLPVRDTLPPNAPNELHFSGSGNYQWYRQGNLTYRVDTVSGRSCIAYATLEEWRKQIVYSNGCGRGA